MEFTDLKFVNKVHTSFFFFFFHLSFILVLEMYLLLLALIILDFLLDFLPSACLGVIAKVIEATGSPQSEQFPAMLETTAAVHPGSSGGAVVNSNGRMIGLVTRYGVCLDKHRITRHKFIFLLHVFCFFPYLLNFCHSNAKHGGGTVIPHLNFSIPCAALKPILKFSKG